MYIFLPFNKFQESASMFFCKSSILPSIIELFFFYDAPLRWSFNYAKISKLTSVPSSGGSHCKSGAMHCLMNSFKSYSRSMDELAYQLNLSDTLDWSYDDDEDETNSTLGKRIAFYEKWYFCKEKFIKPFSFCYLFRQFRRRNPKTSTSWPVLCLLKSHSNWSGRRPSKAGLIAIEFYPNFKTHKRCVLKAEAKNQALPRSFVRKGLAHFAIGRGNQTSWYVIYLHQKCVLD